MDSSLKELTIVCNYKISSPPPPSGYMYVLGFIFSDLRGQREGTAGMIKVHFFAVI